MVPGSLVNNAANGLAALTVKLALASIVFACAAARWVLKDWMSLTSVLPNFERKSTWCV
jgi:hypothetical protein